VETDATQVYNCLVASFKRTQLKGIVFLTAASNVQDDAGANFGEQLSALANGWKTHFTGGQEPHFVYTLPTGELASRITRPAGIKGPNTAFPLKSWPEKDKRGKDLKSVPLALTGLVDAVVDAAY